MTLTADQGQRIIELLEDILSATKANGSIQVSQRGQEPQRDFTGWKAFAVPRFIKAYAGKRLGDMTKRDLEWWAANYQPKEYKGQIQQADIDFRAALDEAAKDPTAGEGATAPPRAKKADTPRQEPSERQQANQSNGPDEDVPF